MRSPESRVRLSGCQKQRWSGACPGVWTAFRPDTRSPSSRPAPRASTGAPDHLCFWHPESRTLLSGDLIAGRGSIIVAPPEGDLDAYMASLERVRSLGPARILPGHGPEVRDAAAKIEEYISHRREREARVVAALRSGASSLEEVVELAYADVPPRMRPYAELGARAHLARLGHPIPAT
jgi:hypothetical protein